MLATLIKMSELFKLMPVDRSSPQPSVKDYYRTRLSAFWFLFRLIQLELCLGPLRFFKIEILLGVHNIFLHSDLSIFLQFQTSNLTYSADLGHFSFTFFTNYYPSDSFSYETGSIGSQKLNDFLWSWWHSD